MKIRERHVDGVVIVDMSGKLTLGAGDVQLRQVVRGLLDRGEKAILLNMADVGYMDSAGVGELVASYSTAESHQAQLKLLHLSSKVRDLLQFTQLITVFDTYDDEREAIAGFAS